MSELLGINIDGFIGFGIDVLRDIFECIGGLDVDFPFDVLTSYKTYSQGINHLEADEVIRLIRHRDGFALADIARVDIQKILISSFITAAKHKIGILTIAKIIGNNYKRLITDLNLQDFISISFSHKKQSSHFKISYCTLPGKVAFLNNMWYYCMCRKGIGEMLDLLSMEHGLVSQLNSSILYGDAYAIYLYDNIEPRIYTKDNFSDLKGRIK